MGTVNADAGVNALAEFVGVNNPNSPTTARGHVPAPAVGTPSTYVLQADATWGPGGGGGGGGVPTITSTWSTGGTAKNSTVTAGVNLSIALSTNQPVTVTAVTVGGVALTGPFTVTGAFPTFAVAVLAANVPAAVQTTGGIVAVQGLFNSVQYSTSGGTLTIIAAIPFTTTLTGSYAAASTPFDITTGILNYAYSNTVGTITAFNGVLTPGGNATATSGSFVGTALTGSTISGTATGTGLNGAGSSTVTLSGTVPAVPVYTPAFYAQTANATVPVFNPSSTQTPGAAQGSIITYTVATAFTQYNWVCTQRPLTNLFLRTPIGDGVLVPDVTAPTQTIAGQVFNVFGWSGLTPGNSSRLVIT